MFATINDVKEITNYDVANDLLVRAQYIVEAFVGRVESDIDNQRDLDVLMRATSYQAAYMKNNTDKLYEQADVSTVAQNSNVVTMRHETSPWLSPIARWQCQMLSFKGPRSVRVGPPKEDRKQDKWREV